ncbi:DUF1549 and DUF1553 domain-containing protein [Akkermansiaceae bacterium]|jgi:hypothetical protein|nr:DUF1549 and DUF1553 domain-containing protein [Akkermansiaceae bacterium]MDB4518168.1 DUF1549 and DUF1553 domain-containing protein [Akkermansiaceae bacterium]
MIRFLSAACLAALGALLLAPNLPAAEITPEAMAKEATRLDKLISSVLQSSEKSEPASVDNATFLRRASLIAIGRIPTLAEIQEFTTDSAIDKRHRLTSRLYQSKGYQSHMNNWLYDHLRLDGVKLQGGYFSSNAPLIKWSRQAVRENKSWKAMTRELLSARGNGWTGSGASHYYTRDIGMPLDNSANTLRAFLGIRMECAQCHDDPGSKWERIDFYNLAAFTHGKSNLGRLDFLKGRGLFVNMSSEKEYNAPGLHHLHFFSDAIGQYAASGIEAKKGSGRIKLPDDYQYPDGDPGELVEGRTPFGGKVRLDSKKPTPDSLEQFATWVVGDENPTFAGSIAARMWLRVMGAALHNDDNEEFLDPKDPVTGALSSGLVKLMREYDYDLHAFQQTLMLTKAFAAKSAPDKETSFHGLLGRPIERMSAEQIWDSLVTLVLEDPESAQRIETMENLYLHGRYIGRLDDIIEKVHSFKTVKAYQDWIIMKYQEARDGTGPEAPEPRPPTYIAGHGRLMTSAILGIARASELPSPADPNHFLQKFGQSDRISIDGATNEGSLTQTLQMLNGATQEIVATPKDTMIRKILQSPSTNEDKGALLFQSILTRQPTDQERSLCTQELDERKVKGFTNIVSALVCTPEFLFIY